MLSKLNLQINSITYGGVSVGREVQLRIKVLGSSFTLDTITIPGERKEIGQVLGHIECEQNMTQADIQIDVIEKDRLFSDSGTLRTFLNIDAKTTKSVLSYFQIRVTERRSWWLFWRKREGVFGLEYDAKVNTPEDSIMWGVRWLYHRTQYIGTDGHRHWYTWEKGVYRYGPNTTAYRDSVWNIYKNGIKKERETTIKLWSFIGLMPILGVFLLGQVRPDLKTSIIDFFDSSSRQNIEDVFITYNHANPSLFAAKIVEEKDWFEQLVVGNWDGRNIEWIRLDGVLEARAIRSTKFVHLKGFDGPILEVYDQGHRGYGDIYLYEIDGNNAHKIFEAPAVDVVNDAIWSEENYTKYGYYICGQSYESGQLWATYNDVNDDGIDDLHLSGNVNVDCEEAATKNGGQEYEEHRVDQFRVDMDYILKKAS